MIKSKTTTTEKGGEKMRRLQEMAKKYPHAKVRIGFFSGAGKYQGTDVEVVEVALFNEYGTRRSPARAFMGPAVDENEDKIIKWRDEAIKNIYELGWTPEKALESIGFKVKTLIENKIKSNVPPPNAVSTTEGKMGSGVLAKSASYKTKSMVVAGNTSRHMVKGDAAIDLMRKRGKTSTLRDSDLMLRSVTYKVSLD